MDFTTIDVEGLTAPMASFTYGLVIMAVVRITRAGLRWFKKVAEDTSAND